MTDHLIDDVTATEIFSAESHILKCIAIEEQSAANHKAAKKRTEAAIMSLRQLVEEARSGQKKLPFAPPDGKENEHWRKAPLEELLMPQIPQGILGKLAKSGIKTMGDLATYQLDGLELVAIAGVGPAAADKIADATEAFWARAKEAKACAPNKKR